MPRAPWWSTYFDHRYLLEYDPLFSLERDRQDVARLIEVLGLPLGARVLDVACGQGRHAHGLAEAGYDVDGLDYSAKLLKRARQRGVGRRLRYTRGDMRKMPARWRGRFDGVVNLYTSFGFFDEAGDDERAVAEVSRVLARGGVFVWHGGSRDGVMARFLQRDEWESRDWTSVEQERDFDPLTGFLTIVTTLRRGARKTRREHRIRLYTATRIAELATAHDLDVEQSFDGFSDDVLTRRSGEMMLVMRKR
ncbi:MAG: methyltransferase domain-containing protein [Gemmatimonadaceae bacterium]